MLIDLLTTTFAMIYESKIAITKSTCNLFVSFIV
jgi:hypothetical protein